MKIRIGNDFVFNWAIERGGLPENLESILEAKLTASVFGKKQEVPFTISGNIITIEFTPEICNVVGSYNLLFTYILPDLTLSDEDRKCAVDVDAFQIVAKTAQADDSSEFSVTSDMAIAFKGDKGDSSYQTWLDAGNTGTEADYLAWIQKPASDIATTVSNAEGLRVTAETNRNNAEGLRLSAEIIRNDNEADRIEAEGLRAGAETGRQTAEGLRVEAETSRNTAEGERQTNTATAILQANAARDLANEKAGLAATATTEANTAAQTANEAADNANDTANHPTFIAPDNYVYIWNKENQEYEKTDIYVKGDDGETIINVYDNSSLRVWLSPIEDIPEQQEDGIIYIGYEDQ